MKKLTLITIYFVIIESLFMDYIYRWKF